jgi:hypothetical protein
VIENAKWELVICEQLLFVHVHRVSQQSFNQKKKKKKKIKHLKKNKKQHDAN